MSTKTRAPALKPVEFGRWIWRQLTSMRIALMLLFLLAVAAIPGSVLPQSDIDPVAVSAFRARNPELSEWYDRLGMFDVYSAPWFAAIYLALMVSLVGCILPRTWQHWKAMRSEPPRAPRRLSRMPAYRQVEVDATPDEVLALARAELRSRRFKLAADRGDGAVSAEAGRLRETGNVLFHLCLVVVLLAVAGGGLFGYRANVLIPEGSGFTNQVIQFDSLSAGPMFDQSDLPPFSLDLESFEMDFIESGPQQGTADHYEATVRFVPEPGAEPRTETIRVNEPLEVDGSLIHIINPGYAPAFTVRDADGTILAEGPVAFLPQDDNFTSTGVVKVQVPPEDGDDLGIEAVFYPTAVLDEKGPRSVFPAPRNPAVFLTAYHGDLGLDDGRPESVFRLDLERMQQFEGENGEPYRKALSVGDTAELPNGSYITFDGYVTWANFQISRNSGKEIALVGAVVAVLGLMGSLYLRRRRVWVRAAVGEQGRTVVEVAGLHRAENSAGDQLTDEVGAVTDGLMLRLNGSEQDRES
ncbi:cytochrome c biogenesis protein [Haloactinopolyspora alba]|uniref:Cytochrome c biogenesis protein n=1 Tax=Haloactinopolyspora alba TaxID=648780 RepID=A0A2P8DGP1_9ACTN|nr:cytochrome c biogenesis protein ResB [Haloactinopolyspora alba]PSK96382.1 cytochrome c biogenesis protein [Haloactinopolyspora alba]